MDRMELLVLKTRDARRVQTRCRRHRHGLDSEFISHTGASGSHCRFRACKLKLPSPGSSSSFELRLSTVCSYNRPTESPTTHFYKQSLSHVSPPTAWLASPPPATYVHRVDGGYMVRSL